MILAGDIGGTKTRIGLFEPGSLREPQALVTYASSDHDRLETILALFRQRHTQPIELACFGVAGPVRDNRSTATNLPWIVDGASLAKQLGLPQVWVINDLEACAYGIATLKDGETVELCRGTPGARGNAAIVAAGTGLGEAGLFWDGNMHQPFSSEGGHSSFAPTNQLESELWAWLRMQWEHVSWERVLSGPGLVNIYRFLRDTGRGTEPVWLRDEIERGDAAAAISRTALDQRSELCMAALDCFSRLYGSEAGNYALAVMATAGVYLSGNIAAKNIEKLRDGSFASAFVAKGRLRPLLNDIAVQVILTEWVNLRGAARCAMLKG